MRTYDIIMKKKRSGVLTREEIDAFVSGYTSGNIPDYQASALLMAICLKGMNDEETYFLTDAIARSGDVIDLSEFGALTADKHSTGGVGDKTTLIVAPIAAALGCKVAKMSGRGLGHTGGTVDKLESIPGYSISLPPEAFRSQVTNIGVAIVGQSGELAPADKKLYALRDVTATVDSIPLIASSIMGKKLASGAKNIVLDVKCGSGAFLKTPSEAEKLASCMVNIGRLSGRRTAAVITNMDIPLGYSVGNLLEVLEAVDTLRCEGPSDLTEICLTLAAKMASLTLDTPFDDAMEAARECLASGAAYRKFEEWISAQGGDLSAILNKEMRPVAKYTRKITADTSGYIREMNAEAIGIAAMELGAGRRTKDDAIDYTAGIVLEKKTGDALSHGDTVATLYTNSYSSLDGAEATFRAALTYSDEPIEKKPLIYSVI